MVCSSPPRGPSRQACQARSNRVRPGLPGADANCLFNRGYEDLAVADATRLGCLLNRLQGLGQHIVSQHDLDLHLWQEVDDVLRTTIKLGMALLPAKPLGLDHGDALQANFLQRLLHLVELEGLDNGFDFFHAFPAAFKATALEIGLRPLATTRRAKVYAGLNLQTTNHLCVSTGQPSHAPAPNTPKNDAKCPS